MAVEARHMNLVPSLQSLTPGYNQMDPELLFSAARPENRFISHQILHSHQTLEKYSINNNFSSAPRKRIRGSELYHDTNLQIHCQIDRLIPPSSEKMILEFKEKKKRQTRMLISEINERIMKKLREKDEEIDRMGKLNWVLQERVQNLCRENQILKDLAYKNELTVHSLRSNLGQVLAQVPDHSSGTLIPADDAGSSCGSSTTCEHKEGNGEDVVGGGPFRVASGEWRRKKCTNCWERESRVLLLPCRHLCACSSCGSNLHTCPVCDSAINTCLLVNFP